MKTIFRVLMVLVGFLSASVAFADDNASACGDCGGNAVASGSGSGGGSSSSATNGHATVTESIATSSIVLKKCGAPTVVIVMRAHMTRNNDLEVNDMGSDVVSALLIQGYHFYKEKCSRGRFAQERTVTITIE